MRVLLSDAVLVLSPRHSSSSSGVRGTSARVLKLLLRTELVSSMTLTKRLSKLGPDFYRCPRL